MKLTWPSRVEARIKDWAYRIRTRIFRRLAISATSEGWDAYDEYREPYVGPWALVEPADEPARPWTAAEWEVKLQELKNRGSVLAVGIAFSGADIRRLVEAAEQRLHDGTAHFTSVNFAGAVFDGTTRFTRATFEWADFGDATFTGDVKFGSAEFQHRVRFRGATFQGVTNFAGAKFRGGADFDQAEFRVGGSFEDTYFEKASFRSARIEGVDFSRARLAGANLSRAYLDYRSSFTEASLFRFIDPITKTKALRPPCLADVRWNGALVIGVKGWEEKPARLGEDPCPSWPRGFRGLAKPQSSAETVSEDMDFPTAIRTYRQVATLLRNEGMTEVAGGFDYRANQLTRRTLSPLKRAASWVLDVLTGYGLKPVRIVIAYVGVVLIFAIAYALTGSTTPQASSSEHQEWITTWVNAVFGSLIAFHGRGIAPSDVIHGQYDVVLPGCEAVFGLFLEALMAAVIVRRLFRS